MSWALEYLDEEGRPFKPRKWAMAYYSYSGICLSEDVKRVRGHDRPEGAHQDFDKFPEKEWPRLRVAELPPPERNKAAR